MAKFPAMPLWTDALLGDTTHLTATEFGAYMRLLISMWRNGAWLPNDERLMAKYATLTSGQWKRSRGVLMPFFTPDGDRITQRKLMKTWVAVEQKSKSAKNSANARWLKEKKTGDANASNPQCERNANQNQNQEEREANASPKKTRISTASFPSFISPEIAQAYLDFRRAKRNPVTTKRVMDLLARDLSLLRDEGFDPNAALDTAMKRGWQGFQPEWVRNATKQQRTNGDDRHARKIEMATRQDRRGETDGGVDHDASGGDPVALLPAEHFGRS